jgi:TrmH family RNA methyltransferase
MTPGGLIVAEGPHLLAEALCGLWQIDRIITTPAASEKYSHLVHSADSEIVDVSESAFGSIAATEHNQGVLTLLKPRNWNWKDLLIASALLVVLDGIQDPGNAGTLVRSAEAFGATGLIFGRGSVHVANSKFLRATVGSIFRIPFISGVEPREVLKNFAVSGIHVYALSADGERAIQDVDLRPSCALVTGNEGGGVSDDWRQHSAAVRIPALQVESLNAAVAGSIALFEASRQRASV